VSHGVGIGEGVGAGMGGTLIAPRNVDLPKPSCFHGSK
jgi:hypothetical protein